MKKIFAFFTVFLFTSIILFSCGLSTDQLAKEVEKSMKENDQFRSNSINIKSLILSKKSGNEYNGVLKTSEPNGEFTYSVEVIYDGKNFTWRIIE
jgi:hypothetical protein